MPALFRTTLFALALVLAACDSGDPDDMSARTIGGDYSATTETFSDGETVTTFAIPTTESGNTFAYSVTVRTERGGNVTSNTSNSTGTYDHPDISLSTDGTPLSGRVESGGDVLEIDNPNGGTFTFRR